VGANSDYSSARVPVGNVFFFSLLLLSIAVLVVVGRKRGDGWWAIAVKCAFPATALPLFRLGFFPGSGEVRVRAVLLVVFALWMTMLLGRRR
jgi:hypothetical protein